MFSLVFPEVVVGSYLILYELHNRVCCEIFKYLIMAHACA